MGVISISLVWKMTLGGSLNGDESRVGMLFKCLSHRISFFNYMYFTLLSSYLSYGFGGWLNLSQPLCSTAIYAYEEIWWMGLGLLLDPCLGLNY